MSRGRYSSDRVRYVFSRTDESSWHGSVSNHVNVKNSLRGYFIPDVRRVGLVTAIAVVLVLLPRTALAHAVLLRSSPAINSTVQGPDIAVSMKFSSRVDGARSTLLLSSADGQSKSVAIEGQSAPDTLTTHPLI